MSSFNPNRHDWRGDPIDFFVFNDHPTTIEHEASDYIEKYQSGRIAEKTFVTFILRSLQTVARYSRYYYREYKRLKLQNELLRDHIDAIEGRLKSIEFDNPEYMGLGSFNGLPVAEYVYVLRDVEVTGYCKIGLTNNPAPRLKEYTHMPMKIKVVALVQVSNMFNTERHLHDKYAKYRTRGEWFNFTQSDIQEVVEQLNDLAAIKGSSE